MGLSLRNITKKIVGVGEDTANAFASPFVSLAKTDIIDPTRTTVAQVTGNRAAATNAQRQQNIDLGLGAAGTNFGGGARQFLGNTGQIGLDIATPGLGKIGEKAIAPLLPRAVPNIAKGIISHGITESALAVPQAEARYISSGEPLSLKGAGQNAVEGAKTGAEFGVARGLGGALLKDTPTNKVTFIGGKNATGFKEAQQAGTVFTGAEDAPKFEGADNLASVSRVKPGTNDSLGNVLHHPTLYSNYPDLAKVQVSVQPLPKGAKAVYSPTRDIIAVSPDTAAHPNEFKSALLHETQHAIQNRENFAAGTNLSDRSAYQASAGEQEARMVQDRANMTPQERAANPAGAVSGVPTVGTKTNSFMAEAGVPNEVSTAIQNLQKHYKETPTFTGNAKDVVGIANGYKKFGARLSGRLANALGKNLSGDEQKAVFDALQGVKNKNLTTRAAQVVKAIRPLYNTASDVRQAIHGDKYNPVLHYAPRIERQTLAGALKSKGGVKGVISSLTDLGNLDSVFSRHRQIGKFVDAASGEAKYGKASDIGLAKHANGDITDAKGRLFKQVPTNTKELAANLGKSYIEKIGHVSGIYHADTTSLLARGQALKELTTNPNAHGLYTEEQVTNGAAPDGVKMINHAEFKTPEGQPLYGLPKDVKEIERSQMFGRPEVTNLPGKLYDTVSNFATQSIVLNPVFHGMNQLYQTAIAAGNMPGMGTGWGRVAKNVLRVNEDDVGDYLKAGGHMPDYGSNKEGWLSDLTKGATKINSKSMATIEMKLRVGLYKSSIESGMKPSAAIKNIDTFLGDSGHMDATLRRTTLFAHYFKTMAGAMGKQIAHPIEQRGSIKNAILLAGITAAVSYGYKEFTGNKNAYVRVPGELGLAKEAITSGRALAEGNVKDAASIVTNRVNPVLKEGLQQAINQDLFTGGQTSDTAPVTIAGHKVIPGGRGGHAVQSLIAPAQQVEKGAGGKRSVSELGTNQLGLYTPHAKGYIASPKVSLLNVKGDKVAVGNDPTGHQQQQAFFAGKQQATKGMSQQELTLYNQMTASTSKMNDKQLQAHYALMSSNPATLATITKQKQDYAKQTGTPLDPLYGNSITPAQQAAYFHLQSLPYKGDDYNQQVGSNDKWLTALQSARNNYFNNNPIAAGDVTKSERVQTPTFDSQTEKDLTTASSLSGANKAQFIDSHPNLTDAYTKLANYTNAKRVAQGNAPFKLYPGADPDTQSALNTYEALKTSADRSSWIKSNPDTYAKVQDYLTNVSQYELANSAGQDKFLGANPSQEELKSAYSLGQYDILKATDANGNTVYSINPAGAYASGGGGGSSFNASDYEIAKLERKNANIQQNSQTLVKKPGSPKVSITKGASGGKKVVLKSGKPVLNKKVALKKSKV